MNSKLLLAVLFVLLGCSGQIKATQSQSHGSKNSLRDTILANMRCFIGPQLQDKGLDDLLRNMRNHVVDERKCLKNDTRNICQWVDFNFYGARPRPSSRGQRVLVFDIGDYQELSLRYQNKIMAIYDFDDKTSSFVRKKIKFKVFRPYHDALTSISRLNYHVPLSAIQCLPSFYTKLTKNLTDIHTKNNFNVAESNHGHNVLGILANNIPDAQFVVAGLFNNSLETFCSIIKDKEQKWQPAVKSELKKIIKDVKHIIKSYDINYINYSAGMSLTDLEQVFIQTCHKKPSTAKIRNLMKLLIQYMYRPLSEINDVVLVQASGKSQYSIKEPSNNQHLSDCVKLKNRLRVGDFDAPRSKDLILEFGTNDLSLLRKDRRNFVSCTDIYVNSGIIHKSQTTDYASGLRLTDNGVLAIPMMTSVSSFLAPLALSHLIYLQNEFIDRNDYRPSVDQLFDLLIGFNHETKLIDPFLYNKLPLCKKNPAYCNFNNITNEKRLDDKIIYIE